MSAWVKQIASQVQKHGVKNASWYCFWHEPDGTRRKKSCGKGKTGKRDAQRMAERLKAQLLLGTYQHKEKQLWSKFREAYRSQVLAAMPPGSAYSANHALDLFERITKPKLMAGINTNRLSQFVAIRRDQKGRNPSSKVTPATINKELRHLRAALNWAVDNGFLDKAPKFKFEKEPKKLPTYVPPEDFAKIYNACNAARHPTELAFSAEQWWKALVTMAFMTGWRIGELLALRWSDVDLDGGTAVTRHSDNKGSRDEKVSLHPVVIEHLREIRSFDERVFPWDRGHRQIYEEFAVVQKAAGIHLPCPDAETPGHGVCTDACHRYGFHDERRAFATLNAEHMTREALQALMRHKDASTTDRYINYARQLNPAVANLHVPDILKSTARA